MSISLSDTHPLIDMNDAQTEYTVRAFLKYVSQVYDVELCHILDDYRSAADNDALIADFLSQDKGRQLWLGRHPEEEANWHDRQELPENYDPKSHS